MKHGIRQVFCDKGSDYAQVSSAPMEFIRAV
jgi:hypothetical protein